MSDVTDAVMTGLMCAECGIFFKEAHGYPVLCHSCFYDYGGTEYVREKLGYQRAISKEL